MSEQLIDAEAAMEALGGIGRSTFWALISAGELPIVKIGRRTFIPRSGIDAYIERNTQVRAPVRQPPVKCPQCGRWFKPGGMALHVRRKHTP
jgi:excisionase family DNA binding protein